MTIQSTARYYETQAWDAVQCLLCPHQCSVAPSRQGRCGVRANRNGTLHSLTYGRVSDATPVSIEEIPFFHYRPGSRWLRVGSVGCTMHCPFCNTWRSSQVGGVRTRIVEPAALVDEAQANEAIGLVFGVTEPAVWHEYLIDVAREARKRGLRTAAATSGMWATEPFAEALSLIDAFLFGFKGTDGDFWQVELGGLVDQARLNLEMAVTNSRHVEASYLVIEGKTDSLEQLTTFSHWLAEVAPGAAVHVIGYKPNFQWDRPATSEMTLRRVVETLSKRLEYVYSDEESQGLSRDTRCPSCKRIVMSRSKVIGAVGVNFNDGHCGKCGARLPILTTDPPELTGAEAGSPDAPDTANESDRGNKTDGAGRADRTGKTEPSYKTPTADVSDAPNSPNGTNGAKDRAQPRKYRITRIDERIDES